LTTEEARRLIEDGALLVDVREKAEVAATGQIKGAVNVSRGMIEFRADPDSPSHDAQFRKDRPIILYCASGARAALAGKTLQQMGYQRVYNLGGFKDLVEAGLPVVAP
jgi:rhodanese-related sulfurtransferase